MNTTGAASCPAKAAGLPSLVIAAALMCCSLIPIAAVVAQQPASGPADTEAEDARLQTLVRLIIDPRTTPDTRRFLLEDLLANRDHATSRAVADMLAGPSEPHILTAVCVALSETDQPDAAILEPLLGLLCDFNGPVRAAAAQALAAYDTPAAAATIGRFALDADTPTAARVAALRAMGEIPEPPESIDALIQALDDQQIEIRQAARESLLHMGLAEPGPDAADWRTWWADHRNDPPVKRLRAVLRKKERRLRTTERALTTATERNLSLLREIYERSGEAEKATRLTSLLRDPQPDVRTLGVELVNAMIADRKDVPPDILEALRGLVIDPTPHVRRAAIPLLRDLRIPTDLDLLVSALAGERDETVICDLLNALGRFGDPRVAPDLLPYLGTGYPTAVIAEAADSLGLLLGSKPTSPTDEPAPSAMEAVEALRRGFDSTPAEQVELRERFLQAMAKIADPSFEPYFLAHIDNGRNGMKAAAIQGLAALGNSDHATQVVRHLSDTNIQVRQLAAQAIGRLGNSEEHLEALLGRLNPESEPVEAIRQTVWESFVRLFRRLEPATQLLWADRLAPQMQNPAATNDRCVELLLEIARALDGVQNEADLMAEVRLRLAGIYADMGRHTDAVAYHQQAFEWLKTQPKTRAWQISHKILRSQLLSDRYKLAADYIAFLLSGASEREETPFAQVVNDFLRTRLNAGEFDDVLALTDRLLDAESVALPENWIDGLRLLRQEALDAREQADQRQVAECITQLDGPEDQVAAARQRILELGPRAVGGLARQVLSLLDDPQHDPALEADLVGLLRQLQPDWPGFSPDTPIEQKRATLLTLTTTE